MATTKTRPCFGSKGPRKALLKFWRRGWLGSSPLEGEPNRFFSDLVGGALPQPRPPRYVEAYPPPNPKRDLAPPQGGSYRASLHGRASINSELRQDERGAAAIEFAIVASVFFMLMLGILEYGLFMFTKSQIEAITFQATREVGIGTKQKAGCTSRPKCIEALVRDKATGLIDKQSLRITSMVVTGAGSASNVPEVPDICLDNVNDPYPANCTKWVENNGAQGYQPSAALSDPSLGGPGALVEVRVTYLWRVLFPFFRSHFGKDGVLTITSATVVKNEPF